MTPPLSPVLAALGALVAGAGLGGCGDAGGPGYPIMPGGGGSGSSTNPDAAVETADASNTISGRVCLISDARTSSCAATGADGFTVTLGSAQAITAADGSFTLVRPAGDALVWGVTGAGIEPSALAYSATASSVSIPALATIVYDEMLSATQAVITGGDGAIIARATRGGAGVAGLVAASSPAPTSEIYYDGATAVDWEQDETGSFGVVWIPSIATGTASITFDTGTSTSTAAGIPVFANTITFVFHSVP